MWEVTDVDDMVLQNLDWTGDKGIDNIIGIYIQHPAKRFVEYFKEKRPLATLTAANTCVASLAVSPKRSALRKCAAEKIAKSASKMKARAMTKSGVNNFDVGNVVKVALADVDRAKTDPQNLRGVIVNVNPKTMMARVAVKSGVLKNWYDYHKLTHVTGLGNNVELLGLSNALVGWSMMVTITKREAARDQSGLSVAASLLAKREHAVASRRDVGASWPAIETTTSAGTMTRMPTMMPTSIINNFLLLH